MKKMIRVCYQFDEASKLNVEKFTKEVEGCNQSDVVRAALKVYSKMLKPQRLHYLEREVAYRVQLKDERKKIRRRVKKAKLRGVPLDQV